MLKGLTPKKKFTWRIDNPYFIIDKMVSLWKCFGHFVPPLGLIMFNTGLFEWKIPETLCTLCHNNFVSLMGKIFLNALIFWSTIMGKSANLVQKSYIGPIWLCWLADNSKRYRLIYSVSFPSFLYPSQSKYLLQEASKMMQNNVNEICGVIMWR